MSFASLAAIWKSAKFTLLLQAAFGNSQYAAISYMK